MSGKNTSTALNTVRGVGVEIAFSAQGAVPEWIMIVPAGKGGVIETVDGRGPYRMQDAAHLAAESMKAAPGGQFVLDETHATDLAATEGRPAPARGWFTDLQARADGIYARVDWNAAGKALMADKAYRFISPVFAHDKAGNIMRVLRASLTNTPNLIGMAALNTQETSDMDLLAQIRQALGLGDTADETAVITTIKALNAGGTAMQSISTAFGLAKDASGETVLSTVKKAADALASVAKAAGLQNASDPAAVVSAVEKLATGVPDQVKALQSELSTVTTRLNTAIATSAKERAEVFVDGEIARGRMGVKALRDHYIARHSVSPESAAVVETEIKAFPIVQPGALLTVTPSADKKELASDPVALAAAATAHQKKLAEQGQTIDYATAVTFVAANPPK
ncbi:phage protease [Bradyrhizobium sp. LA2.1]|uniref:phage protease n=1 Tax=Bradyrhizobium sp. LA2.1 TaxID=3156376 RepID=UPI0033913998